MPVSLTPRELKQKGCCEFEANLVHCVRLGFGSFQNEPPKSVQRNRQAGWNSNSKNPTVNQQEVEGINHGVYAMQTVKADKRHNCSGQILQRYRSLQEDSHRTHTVRRFRLSTPHKQAKQIIHRVQTAADSSVSDYCEQVTL